MGGAEGADSKVSALADIHDPHRNDRLYIVDDPNGTPASRAICLWDFFRMIDTSAELLAILGDETGTGVLVFGTSPTFTTSIITPLATHGTAIAIGDNTPTVAIDSSDWDISTTGVMTGIGNITSNGTIEGATITEGGVAVHNNDEMDASSELAAIIDDETGSGLIMFATSPTITTSLEIGADDSGAYQIDVHDAGTILMRDASDDTSVAIGPVADGTTTLGITGSINVSATVSGAGLVGLEVITNLIDVEGAADLDIGSADVTDVTFITDGGTSIIDGSYQFPDADGSPSAAGELQYDNTVAGIADGALCWYDDDAVRYLVDLATLPSDDDYVVAYDADADGFYMKQDADSGGSTAYDDIGDPDAAGSISFDDEETATYSSATTATDFFTIEATAAFGDISIVKINQNTGNATDGTLLEISTADGEDDPDQLMLANGDDDYVTHKIVEAGTYTIDVTSDGTAAVAIPDPITANGGISSLGTIEAATLTEGGVGVPNLDETDWVGSAELADEDWGDVAISGGAASVEAMTVNDATTGTYYVGMYNTDTGVNLAVYTDGSLSYTQATGTLSATEFAGGGASLTSVDAATGDSATAFFDAGTIEHEYGGLQADISGYTGLIAITGEDTTAEIDEKSELEGQLTDVSDLAEADGDTYTGDHDFGGADLELPQGQTPDADGDVDLDFTDGSVVIQHGSAHAELAAATDVVVGKLIHSFAATLAFPDSLQGEIDNWPLKAIESTEFPHGIVITDIYLKTSASSSYSLNVENWDDPTTINGVNPTIDAIATSTSTEVTEDTITYATIAAGQIIMLDLPTDDLGWIYVQVEYYEPIA